MIREYEYYKSLTKVDKYNLDEVCQNQSFIFSDVAEKYITLLTERDELKDALSCLEAKIYTDLRYEFESKGVKFTEKKIESEIKINVDRLILFNKYMYCKSECDKWGSLKEAFIQRSSMIKHLCELYLGEYFSLKSVKETKVNTDAGVAQVRKKLKRTRIERGV